MFGYIAINKAEMKFRDFDTYHACYCGLCQNLKQRYGRTGQLTLSYDMTFLILLLSGLYEPESQETSVSCIAHPFQKHASWSNAITDYAADMNLVLSYYKCLDDWNDDHRNRSRLNARLLRSGIQKIQSACPEKVAYIADTLSQLAACEKENSQDLDQMAGLFGNIMAEIFVWKQDEWEPTLRRMGFFLGKFIYLLDAFEDVDDDLKNACYNPLIQFRDREDFETYCKSLLTMMIAECSRAFEQLPILTHAEILRNILYSGVWCRFDAICEKRRNKTIQENEP